MVQQHELNDKIDQSVLGRDSRVVVVECELLGAEPQVAVLVEPDGERLPTRHQEPLANVKLGVVDEERPLCQSTMVM